MWFCGCGFVAVVLWLWLWLWLWFCGCSFVLVALVAALVVVHDLVVGAVALQPQHSDTLTLPFVCSHILDTFFSPESPVGWVLGEGLVRVGEGWVRHGTSTFLLSRTRHPFVSGVSGWVVMYGCGHLAQSGCGLDALP